MDDTTIGNTPRRVLACLGRANDCAMFACLKLPIFLLSKMLNTAELQASEFFDCLLGCISLGNQFIQCLTFLGDDVRWCSAYKRFVR